MSEGLWPSCAASTPCAMRLAPRASTQKRTLAGPPPGTGAISPACGMGSTGDVPRHAISKAPANGSGGLPSSSACRPKPTILVQPASTSARTARASSSAAAGGSWRAIEMIKPIPTPVCCSMLGASIRSVFSAPGMPPKFCAYDSSDGATSIHRAPSAFASSATSVISRLRSASSRRQSHAAAYVETNGPNPGKRFPRVSAGRSMPYFAQSSVRVSGRIAPSR